MSYFTKFSASIFLSLGLGNDGKLYAWGSNANNELGNNSTAQNSLVPAVVSLPTGAGANFSFTTFTAGAEYSLALGSDGKLYAWGDNTYGEQGNNSNTNNKIPTVVNMPSSVTGISAIAGSNYSAMAIDSSGKLYTWGQNRYGQLGNGSTTDSNVPAALPFPIRVVSPLLRQSLPDTTTT